MRFYSFSYFFSFKIIDEDVDFISTLPANLKNSLDEDIELEENNPIVAEFVDERPQHVKEIEEYRTSKRWKTLSGKQIS